MVGSNFMEEIDCGSFFDHIDDLLEFPNDDIDNVLVGKGGVCGEFPPFWPENSPDSELPGSDSVFSGTHSNSASDLSAELSVPYEDIVQLEWLSTFVEDSFSGGGLTLEKSHTSPSSKDKDSTRNQFQTSSPVSVLESSTACSNGKTLPVSHEKRARSKRPRPAAFTPRVGIQLISPTASITESLHPLNASSESEGFAESHPSKNWPKPIQSEQLKKKKKIRILPPSCSKVPTENQHENPNVNPPSQTVRKCMHCEITKTPQWRAGPMGPKTLCNACGVRYKSGRLFPEYRPAASPTFIPSLHSNSHKKVIEMRTKCIEENHVPFIASTAPAAISRETERMPRNDLLPASM